MNCKYCRANCTGAKHDREITLCLGYDPPKTNGDFIRSMSDEELAKWFQTVCTASSECSCSDCKFYALECTFEEWLGQEVE